jgi:glycosyltransferase involved in cell wall biosynthesis
MNKQKKRVVFMNGGKHFWNREKEIIKRLTNEFDFFLVINHSKNVNYKILDIRNFCLENNVQLKIIDYTSRRARSLKKITESFKDVREILRFRPDVVYIESFGNPYFALFAALLFDKKRSVIGILDYNLHPYKNKTLLKNKFSEIIYKFISIKFFSNYQLFSQVQAKKMKADFPKKHIFCIRIYLIQNDFIVERKVKRNTKANFLFFGKIHYYKGLDILLESAQMLRKKRNDFLVTVAGDSKDFSEYIKYTKNTDYLDLRVRFLDKEEIANVFNAADYLVLPYREVTQSGPLLIAFNFKVVPIVSNLDGFSEYISDGKNGYMFTSESASDLAEKMEYILDSDSFNYDLIQKNLEEYIKDEFDLNRYVTMYQTMFNSICS